MAIRLSVTSKLDGVRSWSLQARETCPGSIGADGELVPACAGCYAVGGNYRFPNVKAPRIENREDWQRDAWADEMVAELTGNGDRWFRWFDSGDLYAIGLARKVLEVMRRTPQVLHWLPTRMHKFAKFEGVLREMETLANVVVRRSSDEVDGTFTAGVHGSCIAPTYAAAKALEASGVHACHASQNDGKCGDCRACYAKDIPVIAYTAHGRDMAKVLKRFAVIVERTTPVRHAEPARVAA